MSVLKQFLDSFQKQVTELPDVELADLAEDSTAAWARKETEKNDFMQEEFLKRVLVAPEDVNDPRYSGRKVSSKAVFDDPGISNLARLKSNNEAHIDENLDDSQADSVVNEDDSGSDEIDDTSSQRSGFDDNDQESRDEDNQKTEIEGRNDADKNLTTISSDTSRQKAESIQNQLIIWDKLMQLHILSHAALRAFNQLPRKELAKQLQMSADEDVMKNYKTKFFHKRNIVPERLFAVRKNVLQLNQLFISMEDNLLKSSKHTKALVADNDDVEKSDDSVDEEIESSTDNEEENSLVKLDDKVDEEETDTSLSEESTTTRDIKVGSSKKQISRKRRKSMPFLIKEYAKRHQRFEPFRSSVLSKWDERTTLSAAASEKNKKTDFSGFESAVLKQIEQIMSEKHRLIRRTQMKRHDVDRMGSTEDSSYDVEIFDDDDFYQQLLKELIEKKTASLHLRQWLEIQKLRQKRSKRKKVDTKASKGRKIRYVAIPKLVNFFPSMAESAKWSHEMRNQLFKSLFTS
ncbi:unnamed protein product [Thelazia callipaeda]|uniref:Protein AATF n=1 Tax=Thelazia callipaeda TaxID=103827 RepID=A0A0N5CXG7_THECL|nr:unnamed protein product [Thelazia callipaeda]